MSPGSARRYPLLIFATVLLSLTAGASTAGIRFLLFGGPALKQVHRIEPDGIAVRENFRITHSCGYYQFEIGLHHERFGELDPLFQDELFPVPITVRVSREGAPSQELLRTTQTPRIYAHGAQATAFIVSAARLENGRYHVEVTSPAIPTLAGRQFDFRIQAPPKTDCP